jgi:hypothetical protein
VAAAEAADWATMAAAAPAAAAAAAARCHNGAQPNVTVFLLNFTPRHWISLVAALAWFGGETLLVTMSVFIASEHRSGAYAGLPCIPYSTSLHHTHGATTRAAPQTRKAKPPDLRGTTPRPQTLITDTLLGGACGQGAWLPPGYRVSGLEKAFWDSLRV